MSIFEMIEIDVPFCTRTFGTAPCTAALSATVPHKCHNLRATCADPANYSEGTPLTLRFCKDGPIPKGVFAFPVLSSVRETAATVNIAGSDPRMGALGRRGSLSFDLNDFAYHERGIDPYANERVTGAAQFSGTGYRPDDAGQYLAKLKARWPYFANKPVRLVRGYLVAGVLVDVQTRHYLLSKMDGPSNGIMSCEGLDVLDLANEKTALCPKPSPGVLTDDITAAQTTFTITPAGAGAEYPASGRVCIGSEIMDFTRSGVTFTVVRGQRRTMAATHSGGDTVQLVKWWNRERIDEVAADLVLNYTTTPASYVNQAAWGAEVTKWAAGQLLTTDITTPTAVSTLLAELGDLGCTIWPDALTRTLRLKMNTPVDLSAVRAVYYHQGRGDGVPAKDLEIEDRDEDRLTQVVFFSKRLDPTKGLTDEANYAVKMLTVDVEAFSLYGAIRSRKIFTRWLDHGDEASSAILSKRLLMRFNKAPKRLSITLDASERDVSLVDVIKLTTDISPTATGLPDAQYVQVISREEPVAYHDVQVLCQAFKFDGRFGYIMPDGSPVYGSATDEQKRTGAFIAEDAKPYFSDNSDAYRII